MDVQKTTPTSRLRIHLLGQFLVYVAGRALPESEIKGRKARSLLKLIALQRHGQLVRDRAMDALWPDLDESAAASQLYKALHHIRKAFAARSEEASDWIEMSEDLIRLNPPEGLVTDVRQFEETARKGLRDGTLSDLQAAVTAYAGDLLPMDFYAAWAELPREHYRQLYLDVLVALAGHYEQRGELSEAAEMLRLALEKDSALESAHRGLMRIFAKRGQETRAFRQYDLCRDVLRRELGVEPSPETVAALEDVRERRLAAPRESGGLHVTAPSPMAPIVDRVAECAAMQKLLDRLVTGRGGGLLIRGSVGLGKTRLIQELAALARRRGLRVFAGSAREGEGTAAYGPFIEIFEAILRQYPTLEQHLPMEIGRLVPSYTGSGSTLPHADELAAQAYLFAQVQRFFARLAEEGPLVIILDDLHAADEGSRALFNYLLRHGRDLPILLAAATRVLDRSEVDISGVAERNGNFTVLDLDPLSSDDHAGLLQQHAPTEELDAADLERIYRMSEGNPLFALELQRFSGTAPVEDVAARRQRAGHAAEANIPPSLTRIVERQLDGLSPAANHLLYIAAVIGRRVPYELMAAVWSGAAFVDENALFEPLEEATRARLLEERGLDYSFHHALVRETIYQSISEPRRRALHALVARSLMEQAAEDEPVEQIAHHLVRAGDIRQGVHYLVRAGERARQAYAHADALARFDEALDILEELEDSAARRLKRDIHERIGDVYRASGRLEQSYEAYESAVRLANDLPLSAPDLVELHRKIALVAIFRTEIDRSERHLKLAFELVGDDSRARARLLIINALHHWHLNRLEEAVEMAQEALALAEEAEAAAEASQACEILAMTYLPLGQWEEGLKYEMQRQLYGWSPDIVVATDAHLCLWEYHVGGEQPFEQARRFLTNVAEQATNLGDLRCVAVCHYALGTMHLWRGESREAVEELDASLQLHENVGSPAGMAYALARKGVLLTMRGAHDLGWQAVQEGLTRAEQAAVRDHCLQRLYGVGLWNRIEAGDPETAGMLVDQSMRLLEESGACAACALELYPWLAYFYLEQGDVEAARRCGIEVGELAAKTGNPIGKAVAAMIESSLSAAERDDDGASRRRKEAFQLAESAVTEATHSPVVHYLDLMADQQDVLRQTRVAG